MERLQGSLLVASPHLPDPNFSRTVVLMIEHLPDGALGLILNRVSNTTLQSVWKDVCEGQIVGEEWLYVGGPVEGPLMALHGHPDLEGIEVIPHVYFSSEKSVLESLVQQQTIPYRIFTGYSGWGAGQLENELKLGGWLTAPARREHVFEDHDGLWQRVTHTIGEAITRQTLKIRHIPDDPRQN
jgi:putative transcriptional regulator